MAPLKGTCIHCGTEGCRVRWSQRSKNERGATLFIFVCQVCDYLFFHDFETRAKITEKISSVITR